MTSNQPPFFSAIEVAIAADRLAGYRVATTDTSTDLIGRYLWNMALCEALYPSLQCLEVAMRNCIHNAATNMHGSSNWYEPRTQLLLPREADAVARAQEELRRNGKDPNDSGRVIAELHFGFWVSLFNAPYEQVLIHPTIKSVFPYLPTKQRTRRLVLARLQIIRRLRNRVFHHEPIWKRANLLAIHAEICETIGWMSPAMAELNALADHFVSQFHLGPSPNRLLVEKLANRWQPPPKS